MRFFDAEHFAHPGGNVLVAQGARNRREGARRNKRSCEALGICAQSFSLCTLRLCALCVDSGLKIAVRASNVLGKINPNRPTARPLAIISNAVAIFFRRTLRELDRSGLESPTVRAECRHHEGANLCEGRCKAYLRASDLLFLSVRSNCENEGLSSL